LLKLSLRSVVVTVVKSEVINLAAAVDGNDGREGGKEESDGKKNTPLSMSHKLTLGYALLVGVGGLMGYLKSGSQKSLLAGGLSAAVLLYVFRELPTKPVLASTIVVGKGRNISIAE
ncbi:hypothetical protein EUTSA_v10002673mg, partial [Eutrema salsugineum]